MLLASLNIVVIGLIILLTEQLWRRRRLHGEAARKFVHIIIGSFVAAWPLYVSYEVIQITLGLTLLGVLGVRLLNITPSLFDVDRSSFGVWLAPLVMLLVALLEPSRTVFSVVVLHVALADGFAAVVGSRFGRRRFAWQKKTALGTLTFFAVSILIMVIALLFQPVIDVELVMLYLVIVPLTTSFLEYISPYGLDNLTVPLAVFLLLGG